MANYPHLTEMIKELAYDNGINMKPVHEWNWTPTIDFVKLEATAATLTLTEKLLFVAGEESELKDWLGEYPEERYQRLIEFLEATFDGEYTELFYD
jgi:hypothetical protein